MGRYQNTALLIQLWDDFAAECHQRGLEPDYPTFTLWLDAFSAGAKRNVLNKGFTSDTFPNSMSDNSHRPNEHPA